MSDSFQIQDLFVSPAGNDAWRGNLPQPNPAGTNGPLKTIGKAQKVIRIRKTQGEFVGPVTVWLREGEYFLSAPLRFGREDGFVTYASYPGEKPVINAGVRITGFAPSSINGHACWKADVTDIIEKRGFFQQLFVNGNRRVRARMPKQGFYRIEDIPESGTPDLKPGSFRCRPGDFKNWSNPSDIEILTFNLWVEQRMRFLSYDEKTQTVNYSRRTRALREGRNKQYARYYIENIRDELTDPGEWYLDKNEKVLYYLPCAGESMEAADVVASMDLRFMEIQGKPEAEQFVENLCFRGLTFSCADWRQPQIMQPRQGEIRSDIWDRWAMSQQYDIRMDPAKIDPGTEISGTSQSSFLLPGAIFLLGAHNCAIEDCTISHVGWHAVELGSGCKGNRIVGNTIHDSGGGGIKVSGEDSVEASQKSTGRNLVTDNHIYDCGSIFPGASGIMIMHSFGNLVAHNHVHDLFYTAISVGATWGYRENICRNNRIEKNVTHDIGKKVLSDCAGIYLLGVHAGTSVRHNVVYNVTKSDYGAFGINLDEGNRHVLVEGNLFYNIESQAFHVHFGEENIIRNNVFAFADEGLIALSRGNNCRWIDKGAFGGGEISMTFTFERNIVVTDGQPIFIGGLGDKTGNADTCSILSDLNLFFDRRGEPLYFGDGVHGKPGREALFNTYTLDEWKGFGYDAHSIIADPQFEGADKGNFALKTSSPALALGFRPLEIADAGVRPPEKRTGRVRTPLTELDTDKFGYW